MNCWALKVETAIVALRSLDGLLGPPGVADIADGVQDALFDAPVRTSATIVRPAAESG